MYQVVGIEQSGRTVGSNAPANVVNNPVDTLLSATIKRKIMFWSAGQSISRSNQNRQPVSLTEDPHSLDSSVENVLVRGDISGVQYTCDIIQEAKKQE